MSFNINPILFVSSILLSSMTSSSFALPATQETAIEVLKTSLFDQTIQHYQTERLAQHYSQNILRGIPSTDLVEDKAYYEAKIEKQLLKQMQSDDFKNYYIQQLIQPYLRFYQEEELVHLLHIYEHPLAQDFFKQNQKSIKIQQDESYKPEQIVKIQRQEQQVLELLKTLTPK
ncbi:hypothetical protein [Acinetobacter haemolyticus]|uniref:hypothetical protein n=1 Tax=Acinetobacter haemolyticus TaxID=29430 RepID=UPI003F56ACE7